MRFQILAPAVTVRPQDVGHRHLRILRHIDQPVVAFGGGAVSLGHAAEGAPRSFAFGAGDVHQSFAQPRISQWRAAELLFRPRVRLQAVCRTECATSGVGSQLQFAAEILLRRRKSLKRIWIHINIFDSFLRQAETILSAAALRPAHPYPIGGPITSARKTGAVYKTGVRHRSGT